MTAARGAATAASDRAAAGLRPEPRHGGLEPRQRRALRVELGAEVALHARAGRVDVGRQAPLGGVEERRAGEERLLVGRRRRRRCGGGRGARRRRRRRCLAGVGGVDDDLQRIDRKCLRVTFPR